MDKNEMLLGILRGNTSKTWELFALIPPLNKTKKKTYMENHFHTKHYNQKRTVPTPTPIIMHMLF